MGNGRTFCLLLVVVSVAIPVVGSAQLGVGNWPTWYRDSSNTVSTPVLLTEQLNVLWEAPGTSQPLVYSGLAGEFVISGSCVYDAWSGALIRYLPYADPWQGAAISTSLGILLTHCGSRVYAYDLADGSLDSLWSLDVGFEREVWLACRDDVFYVSGYHPPDWRWGIAAIEGGALKWKKLEADLGIGHYYDVRMPAVTGNAVFVALSWGTGNPPAPDGVIALDAAKGAVLWTRLLGEEVCALSADEELGLVFSGPRGSAIAYSAADGQVEWQKAIDNIALNPPTLGWVRKGDADIRAVFTAAGSDTGVIYAHSAATGDLLWCNDELPGTWTSATFSGGSGNGKLYVGALDGLTYVLDANTGVQVQLLGTDGIWGANAVPAIVEVATTEGPQSVMYYLEQGDRLAAWSRNGTNPPPQLFQFTLSADPDQIAPLSESLVTATLLDGQQQPVCGAAVSFSCDAGKNQGRLLPVSDVTDANGQAHTVYSSGKREGVVTVTASVAGVGSASTTITVTKAPSGEPTTGTVTGTVVDDATGKPARKVAVLLVDALGQEHTTSTNPQGKYSFAELPLGSCDVECVGLYPGYVKNVELTTDQPSATVNFP